MHYITKKTQKFVFLQCQVDTAGARKIETASSKRKPTAPGFGDTLGSGSWLQTSQVYIVWSIFQSLGKVYNTCLLNQWRVASDEWLGQNLGLGQGLGLWLGIGLGLGLGTSNITGLYYLIVWSLFQFFYKTRCLSLRFIFEVMKLKAFRNPIVTAWWSRLEAWG